MANFPQAPAEYDPRWAAQLVAELEAFQAQQNKPTQQGYTTSNVTTTRTIDADTATTAEIADVLCTLIEDLKAVGRLG